MYTYSTFYNVKPEDISVTVSNGELSIRVYDESGSHVTILNGKDIVALTRALMNVQVKAEPINA